MSKLFIIGFRRSGTTLLKKIMQDHPRCGKLLFEPHDVLSCVALARLNRYRRNPEWPGHEIIKRFRAKAGGAKIAINPGFDKMEWLALPNAFPGSQFVFIHRDPESTWQSYAKVDGNLDRGLVPKQCYMEMHAYYLQRFIEIAKSQVSKIIRYEELIQAPDETMTGVYRSLGWPAPTESSSDRIKRHPFRVVAFYTVGTRYEEEVEGFKKSCREFKIPHHVESVSSEGIWVKNCGKKPEVILRLLEKFPDENLLYVDIDARFRSWPSLAEVPTGDVAVHYRNGKTILSGTILVKNNDRARRLLRAWSSEQKKHPLKWDQRILQRVIESQASRLGVSVGVLPANYCKIFDIMRRVQDPVIEHFQASRKYKKNLSL